MKRKCFLVLGILLIAFSVLWYFWLAGYWTQRIPPDWSWEANFIGLQTPPDETGNLPRRDMLNLYVRNISIVDERGRPNEITLKDRFTIIDPATGKVTWEYITQGPVDPRTGMHAEEAHKGDYIVFPRNVEKKTYRYRGNYLKDGIPLSYKGEEEMEGVVTYVFGYKGAIEYTESYAGTDNYPGFKVPPGQEIRCADDQFIFNVWVEPATGEIVKLEESCLSGDYIYDVSTGKKVAAVLRWGGTTAGEDNLRRVEQVGRERTKLLFVSRYLPLSHLAAGVALCAACLAARRKAGR